MTFTDDTELKADAVILAYVVQVALGSDFLTFGLLRTGFENIRELSKKSLGADTVDRTTDIYGLDAEGELNGSYRPCGHPGVSACSCYSGGEKLTAQPALVCYRRFLQ